MKICIDARVLESENHGISRYLRENVYWLSQKKNVEIYLISNKKIITNGLNDLGNVKVIEDSLYQKVPGTIWLNFFANRLVKQIAPDFFWGPAHILPYAKVSNVKYIVTIHDLVHIFFPETMTVYNKYVSKFFFKKSVTDADLILSVSATTKKDILNNFHNLSLNKIVVTYLGGAEKFKKLIATKQKEKIKRIFMLGSLEPRKNINYFLHLFKEMLKVDSNIHLYLTGSASWKSSETLKILNTNELENKVTVLGFISDEEIEKKLNEFDLLVIPSIYEGFGLPLIEAQSKINILISDIEVFRELGSFFDKMNYLDLNKSIKHNSEQIVKILSDQNICSLKSEYFELFTWKYSSELLYNHILDIKRGQ